MAINYGFSEEQLNRLDKLFDKFLARLALPPSAPPPAPPALQPAPSELPHIQSTSAPNPTPVSARSAPPPPSVETIEEVEYKQIPLRNIQQMRKKHRASKKTRTGRMLSAEICIGWPTKIGGSNMLFSRDEDLDAWYTTMLNTRQKLVKS